jgi:Tfp pilus assembly protein PilF
MLGGVRAREGLRGALKALALVALATSTFAACGGGSKNASTSTSTPKVSFSVLIGAGRDLLRQGNTSGAEQLFARAVARQQNNPVGHYDLGVVLQRLGDDRGALRQYRLAVAHDSRYTPALYNEAVLIAPRDPALAIYYYRRIVAIKPNASTAFLNLGLLQAATGWPRKTVLTSLRRAVSLDPRLRANIPARLRHGL